MNYNFSAASATEAATQSGTISLSNLSGVERTYNIRLVLPTAAASAMTGLFNGSLSGTVITSGAGYFRSVASTAIWAGSTDAVSVGSLFASPVNITRTSSGATSMGSQSFGGGAPSTPSSLFGSNVAINLNFVLSANATVSFSSALGGVGVAVPAPGAFALVGMAGLGMTRRRRR